MAGTVTIVHDTIGTIGRIVCTCVADASDGSFPATALPKFSGQLLALKTNPGATAPQANYDIALDDQDGIDALQGVGANRHTSNSEDVAIIRSGTEIHPPVALGDTLTLKLTNNDVNSAISVVTIYYQPGK